MKFKTIAAGVFMSGLATSTGYAAEGVSFGGPVGATDINNAYLPPLPGVFVGVVNVPAFSSHAYGSTGNAGILPITANATALYVGYEYPFKVFGGSLASGIEESYFDYNKAQVIPNVTLRPVGWGNIYVDFLNWSRYVGPLFGERLPASHNGQHIPYGLTVKLEYSMLFPTSVYEPDRAINVGSGTFFFIPNAAATYLTPPDGLGSLEFDAHVFYDKQTTNFETDYKSGDVVDLDFAAAQRIGIFEGGIVGNFATQLNDDRTGSNSTVVPDKGNKLKLFDLGPIISFEIPALKSSFKVKATLPILTRNSAAFTNIVAVYAMEF